MKVARCVLGRLRSGNTPWLSDAELMSLWKAANTVCGERSRAQVSLLKFSIFPSRAKVAQGNFGH